VTALVNSKINGISKEPRSVLLLTITISMEYEPPLVSLRKPLRSLPAKVGVTPLVAAAGLPAPEALGLLAQAEAVNFLVLVG
jgi:hypothetical protein